VKPQAERYERLYVSMLEAELQTSVVEHRAIVRAIRGRQRTRARRRWRPTGETRQNDWRRGGRVGERGSW
jgi:DNA-binding FadR family transcriptional regulator